MMTAEDIYLFFTNNIVILTIVAALTVIYTIVDKSDKLFTPIKIKIIQSINKKRQRKENQDQAYKTMQIISDKLIVLQETVDANTKTNAEIGEHLREIDKKIVGLGDKILENEADRLRDELFNVGNRCRQGIPLNGEEYRHTSRNFQKYSEELKQNGLGAMEFNYITEYYNSEENQQHFR